MQPLLDEAIRANPMIVTRKMEKGAVLMNTTNGDCYELNAIGARVWEEIGRGAALPSLIDALARDYGVEAATVSTDVLRLVDDLARQGIVTLSSR